MHNKNRNRSNYSSSASNNNDIIKNFKKYIHIQSTPSSPIIPIKNNDSLSLTTKRQKQDSTAYTGNKEHDKILHDLLDKYDCKIKIERNNHNNAESSSNDNIKKFATLCKIENNNFSTDTKKARLMISQQQQNKQQQQQCYYEYEFDEIFDDDNDNYDQKQQQKHPIICCNINNIYHTIYDSIINNTISSCKDYYQKYFLHLNTSNKSKRSSSSSSLLSCNNNEDIQRHSISIITTGISSSSNDSKASHCVHNTGSSNSASKKRKDRDNFRSNEEKLRNNKTNKNYYSHQQGGGMLHNMSLELVDELFNQLYQIATTTTKSCIEEEDDIIKFALEISVIHTKTKIFKIFDILTPNSNSNTNTNAREKKECLNIKLRNDDSDSFSSNLVEPQPIRKICFDPLEAKRCIQQAIVTSEQLLYSSSSDAVEVGCTFITLRVVIVNTVSSSTRIVPHRITIVDMPYNNYNENDNHHSDGEITHNNSGNVNIQNIISLLTGDTSSFLKQIMTIPTSSNSSRSFSSLESYQKIITSTAKSKITTPISNKMKINNQEVDQGSRPSLQVLKFVSFLQNLFSYTNNMDTRNILNGNSSKQYYDVSILATVSSILNNKESYETTKSLLTNITNLSSNNSNSLQQDESIVSSICDVAQYKSSPYSSKKKQQTSTIVLYNPPPSPQQRQVRNKLPSPNKAKWRKSLVKLSCASPTSTNNNASRHSSSYSSIQKKKRKSDIMNQQKEEDIIKSWNDKIQKLEEYNLNLLTENKQYKYEKQVQMEQRITTEIMMQQQQNTSAHTNNFHLLLPNSLREHIELLIMTKRIKGISNTTTTKKSENCPNNSQQRYAAFPLIVPRQWNMHNNNIAI